VVTLQIVIGLMVGLPNLYGDIAHDIAPRVEDLSREG
jgi:hypothetical protein